MTSALHDAGIGVDVATSWIVATGWPTGGEGATRGPLWRKLNFHRSDLDVFHWSSPGRPEFGRPRAPQLDQQPDESAMHSMKEKQQ